VRSVRTLVCLCLAAAAAVAAAPAQEFGQNKITYRTFKWTVYRSPHFDVHYYFQDDKQLEEVVSEIESAYLDLSKRLDHELSARIPILLYRTHTEFEQTNVQMGEIPEFVGAFAEPFQNRMVLPIDQPPDRRYKLIRHEMTHIFQFDIFYAGSLRRMMRAAPPTWLMEGMASYLADDEDTFDQMVIRDAVLNNLVPSIRQLDVLSFLTYRYGNAIFDFIETNYGPQGVRNFLFEFRKSLLSTNPEKAFKDAFGLTVDAFDRRFARFLRQRYLPVLTDKRAPEDYGKEDGLTEPGRYTFSPALSPSGELIAALATPGMKLDVVILSAKDGKIVRNLTKGFTNRYDEVTTGAFQGERDLSWSPDGDRLAFFVKKENFRQLMVYEVRSGRLVAKVPFKGIALCASPAFSPDGRSVAFSGNQDGYWDIFRYDFDSKRTTNLTQDEYFDSNPTWSADGRTILYDRRIGPFTKIFTVAADNPSRKLQLTAGAASDIQPAFSKDGKWIYFSSDRGRYGVFNLHRLELATGAIERLTDLAGGAFAPTEMAPAPDGAPRLAYAGYFGGTFRVYEMKVAGPEVERARRIGAEEPQTSPLAPSRRAAFKAETRARAKADLAAEPPVGAPPAVPTPTGAPRPAAPEPTPLQPPQAPPAAPPAPAAEQAPPPPAEGPDADLRPFTPPLALGLDQSRKSPYKVKWDVEAPSVTVGVTDDGRFLASGAVTFSDLLGDKRIVVLADSVSNYSNLDAAYVNLGHRLDWGVRFQDYRNYYLFSVGGRLDSEEESAQTQASLFAAYPINRRFRVEGALGFGRRSIEYPIVGLADPNNPQAGLSILIDKLSDTYPTAGLALVGDTTRYQSWGPFQGYRFRLEASETRFVSGDSKNEHVTALSLDFRGYQRITPRTLIAFRLAGVRQSGERAGLYSLGGTNELRGYDYREFVGQNIAYANVEFRFPLIDELRWGFGGAMGPFRGFVFADVGTAWFDDYYHYVCRRSDAGAISCDPTPVKGKAVYDADLGTFRDYRTKDDAGRWMDIHGSAGLGFHVQVLGLPFTWSFAKVYDGKTFGPYKSSFYIVYDW